MSNYNKGSKVYEVPPDILTKIPVFGELELSGESEIEEHKMPDSLISLHEYKQTKAKQKEIAEAKDRHKTLKDGQTEADRIRSMTMAIKEVEDVQLQEYCVKKTRYLEHYYNDKLKNIIEKLGLPCTFSISTEDFGTSGTLDIELLKTYLCHLGYEVDFKLGKRKIKGDKILSAKTIQLTLK